MCASAFALAVETRRREARFTLTGEFDAFAAPDLAARADGLPAGISRVRIDLGAVTFLDAGGLEALLRLRGALVGRGVSWTVERTSERVRWVCTLAQVTDALGVEPLPEALRCRRRSGSNLS